jgi:16S rRNA G966 N2-methylase RsmD
MQRKLATLLRNPDRVIMKYLRNVFGRAEAEEDYDVHWNYVDFRGKTVLDVGADWGSTARFFLGRGASKVVAVEGDSALATRLRQNFAGKNNVVCIEKLVTSFVDFESLIRQFKPDIVKVDVEGAERYLLNVSASVLSSVEKWLIETHSPKLYHQLQRCFRKVKFRSFKIEYGKYVANKYQADVHAKKNINVLLCERNF